MLKRAVFFLLLTLLFVSCNDSQKLQDQIDKLKFQTLNSYKPGLGEFMSNIQIHHAKLWFAGMNQNWQLADFELNEISETVTAIQKYETEREESKSVSVLFPALDSVRTAIQKHDAKQFVQNYTELTTTCNACHQMVKFGFNVVKEPDTPPFSNQEFSVKH